MYYANVPAAAPGLAGPDKQQVYLPAPYPPAAPNYAAPTAPASAIHHPGLRFAPQPPTYAMVSQPGPPAYLQPSLPQTSTAYLPHAAQYPPGMVTLRSTPSTPGYPVPVSAGGAPLIAAGYPPGPAAQAIPAAALAGQAQVAAAPRHYQIATFPPGYPLPAGNTVPLPYGAASFGPPF